MVVSVSVPGKVGLAVESAVVSRRRKPWYSNDACIVIERGPTRINQEESGEE